MNLFRHLALCLPAVLVGAALSVTTSALAQTAASLHGHVADASGRPLTNAVVQLVSDQTSYNGQTWRCTVMTDSLGKFSQEGLAPGAYLVMLFLDGKDSTALQSLILKAGEARELDLTVSGLPNQAADNRLTLMADRSRTPASTR